MINGECLHIFVLLVCYTLLILLLLFIFIFILILICLWHMLTYSRARPVSSIYERAKDLKARDWFCVYVAYVVCLLAFDVGWQ